MYKNELRPVSFKRLLDKDGTMEYENISGWFHGYSVYSDRTCAIIEKQDGKMVEVGIEKVSFTDRKVEGQD